MAGAQEYMCLDLQTISTSVAASVAGGASAVPRTVDDAEPVVDVGVEGGAGELVGTDVEKEVVRKKLDSPFLLACLPLLSVC